MDMRKVQDLATDESDDTKMDLNGSSADTYTSHNQTNAYASPMILNDLPTTILESFIPGYRLISRLIYQATGIDINLFVSIFAVIVALATGLRFLWDRFYMLFSKFYMSSIHINDEDDLFQGVLDWIATRKVTKTARTLKAVTRTGKDWIKEFAQDNDDSIGSAVGNNSRSSSSGNNGNKNAEISGQNDETLGAGPIFNFKQLEAKVGPRFEPYYGTHHFWFRGRLFLFQRTRRDIGGGYLSYMALEEQLLTLSTPGRSTVPLKHLIREIKDWSFERQKHLTVIRRPRPMESHGYKSWIKVTVRPSRSLNTVALDGHQKSAIVRDVNHFLHPATPLWYSSRGIPYRRGYLFHGPPGTGKTSLVFALAGLFGLNIFCLSLLDPELSESQLICLVNDLPYRSLVLLEDIDSAGLSRSENDSKENANDSDDSDCDDDDTAKSKKSKKKKGKAKKCSISLSGLLNAIDGVAIQEGRLLVMTTNHPDRLDEALVRPGRVDMQVKFGLATQVQVYDIFVRMFQRSDEYASDTYHLNSKLSSAGNEKEKAEEEEEERLEDLAEQFAAKVPDCKLSPAEIQGFLLLHSEKPREALNEVEAWCRDKLSKA